MGNCVGFSPARQISETIVNKIDEALRDIYRNPGFDIYGWHAFPYGIDLDRNQGYEDLVAFLKPLVKQAYKNAGIELINSNLNMENYLGNQISNLIVHRLLGDTTQLDLNEVTKDRFSWKLPVYTAAQKQQLRTSLSQITPELAISLSTQDVHEKELLNGKLATQVMTALQTTPDLGAEMTRMLGAFNAAVVQGQTQRNGLFAALSREDREAIERATAAPANFK